MIHYKPDMTSPFHAHKSTPDSYGRLLALLYSEQSMRYLEQDKCDAARPLLQRSLAMFETVNGSESPEVSSALTRLAWLSRRQEKYAEAEDACRRVLKNVLDGTGTLEGGEVIVSSYKPKIT